MANHIIHSLNYITQTENASGINTQREMLKGITEEKRDQREREREREKEIMRVGMSPIAATRHVDMIPPSRRPGGLLPRSRAPARYTH